MGASMINWWTNTIPMGVKLKLGLVLNANSRQRGGGVKSVKVSHLLSVWAGVPHTQDHSQAKLWRVLPLLKMHKACTDNKESLAHEKLKTHSNLKDYNFNTVPSHAPPFMTGKTCSFGWISTIKVPSPVKELLLRTHQNRGSINHHLTMFHCPYYYLLWY